MYKLVAIDLDGTMLNSYGEVTENTKRVVKDTMKKGIEVVVASGRSIDSIRAIVNEIGDTKYMIAGNGAVVYDIPNEKVIYEKYIPKQNALDIIKICEENSIFYSVYTDKAIIANNLKYNVLYYYKDNFKKEDSKKTRINIVENIYDYVENMQDEKVMKVLISDITKSVFTSIIKKFEDIQDLEVLDVSHMSKKIIKQGTAEVPLEYYYTEITKQNVNKWDAIEFLLEKLGLQKEEVIAIGDNINDKKMIEEAGLGVAMKGCNPRVSEIADYIADGNDNEGVAKALEDII